jgi:raffinose/stachyose/melibiose transport system permease protein
MLRPVTATVAIVNALWIWNDFLLPRLVLTQETQTLPLSTYLFYGQYSTEYGQATGACYWQFYQSLFST